MWTVETQCILSVYSVYTQPMSCILGGFCFFPQCIIHNRLMGGWIWESVSMWVSNHFFNILSDVYSVCVCWMYNMEQFPAKETEARVWVLAATVYTCLGYSHHLLISSYLHFYIKKNLSFVMYIPIPEVYTMYKIRFCARQRMAHWQWFILCGLSSASVPSQSRSNPPTDPAPRPSDWCLRGVENYAASISISHHLLKLQLIQLQLAPSALLSSNSLKLQPMLCACSVISVAKDFSSLSDVTWYSVHVLRCHHLYMFYD